MTRWLDHLKQNIRGKVFSSKKEGASLVSVVIGVVFLAAIGLTVLTVATRYIINVVADRETTDNFYQTEGILSELRTRLLEKAGDSAETAYTDIFEHYTDTSYTTSMKEKFSKEYLTGIATSLLESGTYTWDDSKLGVSQVGSIDKLKKMTRVPDAVETVDTRAGGDLHFVINKTTDIGYTLTIKDLVIDYTDDSGYRSSIHTDMVFKVPDYKFEGDSTLNEIKKYIVINDDKLTVNGANIGTDFIGNVYTGNMDSGISIESGDNIVNFNSKTIITRGSLDAYSGSTVSLQGEGGTVGDFWVQNIRLLKNKSEGSTLSTNLSLNGNAYVSNDLDIQDSESVVNLAGKYYGYSYNEENSSSGGELNAKYSSAILVNGLNTTLNGNGLDKLILAGRAFVEKPEESDYNRPVDVNIMTGESLSIKSNQLAYLVPDSFIGGTDIQHNPLATVEVTDELLENVKNSLLADPSLSTYLDQDEPVVTNYNNKGYVFLFMNFASEAKSNEYFAAYYDGTIKLKDENDQILQNQEQLREKGQTYLSVPDMGSSKFSGGLSLVAGNILYNYETAGSIQSPNYFNGTSPKENLLSDGRTIAIDYLGKCRTLLASGARTTGGIRLDASQDEPLVATKIIKFDEITENASKVYKDESDNVIGKITVKSSDYTVGSEDDNGLLIVKGNVTVSSDFKGLILASGTVTVTGNHELQYDMITIGNILEQVEQDEDFSKYFHAFDEDYKESNNDINKCIVYQNWEKNNVAD